MELWYIFKRIFVLGNLDAVYGLHPGVEHHEHGLHPGVDHHDHGLHPGVDHHVVTEHHHQG